MICLYIKQKRKRHSWTRATNSFGPPSFSYFSFRFEGARSHSDCIQMYIRPDRHVESDLDPPNHNHTNTRIPIQDPRPWPRLAVDRNSRLFNAWRPWEAAQIPIVQSASKRPAAESSWPLLEAWKCCGWMHIERFDWTPRRDSRT